MFEIPMGVEGGTASGLPEVLENDYSSSESFARTVTAVAALTAAGITGRVMLQHFPSVEPLVPAAIASGYLFGRSAGFASGFTGFVVTNFLVWGGHGPWSFFQVFGAGLAGYSGSMFSGYGSRKGFFASMIAGTLIYEAVVNLGSLYYMPLGILGALPFAAIHLSSSLGFGAILYGFRTDIRRFTRR